MKSIICFDMDGTLADLYAVPDWLQKLRSEDSSPYVEAKPIYNMRKLTLMCGLLQKSGYEIQIITACSKNATPEYKRAIRNAKLEWLNRYDFPFDRFHCIDYKGSKNDAIRRELKKEQSANAILIDDEERHTKKWKFGDCIYPDENLLLELWNMIPDTVKGE